MNLKTILASAIGFAAIVAFASCKTEQSYADYRVIPEPSVIALNGDSDFILSRNTEIAYGEENDGERNARFLAGYIKESTGLTLKCVPASEMPQSDVIVLSAGGNNANPEGYSIKVSHDKITISASTGEGVFRGIQTLRKSIGADAKGNVAFPAVKIEDAPRIGHRGFMLDIARTFFPMEEVKRIIDLVALHNMNVFHWHLTDDQGWRIEIKKYPKLIEIGSVRADTTASGRHEGYYTQEQIKEVIKYAADRYITVIPEIDMPGHMVAALASYPELGCTGGPYEITSQPGVRRDILCVGNPQTMQFVKDVLSEVAALFPAEYIHIGGDESPRDRWKECPKCQARIKELGLKQQGKISPEDQLQGWFNSEIEAFLHTKGKRIIGWDEIVDGGLSPDATVMSWRGTQGGIRAAQRGHDVIMSPNGYLYFDYYQSMNLDTEPRTIGGYVPLRKVYGYDPISDELSPEQQKHIVGVQANAWTPYMINNDLLEHMILPRMAALAEIGWTSPDNKNFVEFLDRLDRLVEFYKRDGYNYSPTFFEVLGTSVADYDSKSVKIALASLPEATIHYTLDGTRPNAGSPVFTDTLDISSDASIRAVAILDGGRESALFKEDISFNKATMKPIRLLTKPAPKYEKNVLNDGLVGKHVFTFGNWMGFQKEDLEVVIDLEEKMPVSEVAFNTHLDYGSHIMEATGATLWISDDGENFTRVANQEYAPVPYAAAKEIFRHSIPLENRQARYVKLQVRRSTELPEKQFPIRGIPFLFVDEIYIF